MKKFVDFKLITKRESTIWNYIDKFFITKNKIIHHAFDELMIENAASALTFSIQHQLKVCISQNYLNEHNMSNDFVKKLIEKNETKTQHVLKFVINRKIRIYDSINVFDIKIINNLISKFEISHYCVWIRSVTIISNTIY